MAPRDRFVTFLAFVLFGQLLANPIAADEKQLFVAQDVSWVASFPTSAHLAVLEANLIGTAISPGNETMIVTFWRDKEPLGLFGEEMLRRTFRCFDPIEQGTFEAFCEVAHVND